MQTLKPQNLLHKWQELTQSQRQLTIINTKAKVAFRSMLLLAGRRFPNSLKQHASWFRVTAQCITNLHVRLFTVATKSLQVHLKRCDWRERKRPHTGRENQNIKFQNPVGLKAVCKMGLGLTPLEFDKLQTFYYLYKGD